MKFEGYCIYKGGQFSTSANNQHIEVKFTSSLALDWTLSVL